MHRKKRSLVFLSVVGLMVGSSALQVHAVTGTWINTATQPSIWGDSANWSGGTIADGADFTANFTANIVPAVNPYTVTLDTSRTIGNITFTDSTTNSHDLAISGANILTLDRSDATKPTINVTQASPRRLTISSTIAGNDGLQKTGTGDLVMSGANTFTGGVDLAAGRIVIFDNANEASNLGAAGNTLTFTGNATLHNDNNTVNLPQNITINSGVTGSITGAFAERTIVDGVLAGSGTLFIQGFSADFRAEFRNTANTFTGAINIQSGDFVTFGVRSLADSAATIGLDSEANNGAKFEYLAGAIAPLVFNNRQFVLTTNGNAGTNLSRQPSIVSNAALANTVTINTNLLITGTGTKRFVLEGGNLGNNTFAGAIPDAIGADVLHLHKQGAGKWILAGTNTYEGDTNVDQGNLTLASTGSLLFDINANGVNNRIRGDAAPGTVTLDGSFNFDLSGANTAIGNIWNIVDASILAFTTYNPTFAVNSFTNAGGGLWTFNTAGVQFRYSQTAGTLSTVQLTSAAIPEPASATLAALGLAALMRRRHRRMA